MNAKALQTLEFNRITEFLTEHAQSAPGRHMCETLKPSRNIEWIEKSQTQTEDAYNRIMKFGSTSFGSNRDMGYALKSLEVEATLSIVELIQLAALLENVARIKNYGGQVDRIVANLDEDTITEAKDSLSVFFDELEPLPSLSGKIRACIISEEEIADDASPALKNIRREIKKTNDSIHSYLTNMINGSARTYLQDPVITMRGDRYCIPVKAEHKGQVPGMVHDQSATGSTFFIEPAAVVEYNNKLRELALLEQKEIEKILAELSANAAEHTEDIAVDCKHMTMLDFIFAKAELAIDMKGSRPLFNTEHRINIRKGRHPLIDPKKVVPIDVSLGDKFGMLIVTGPNTGGKTVSLKTVGLLTLMGQAGLFIPAGDRSELSVFKEVYADIGDEQSIEQNLSTFSAHMTNIVGILKNADEDSLCLFDELGAGTDPVEGAALATAILDDLHSKGIRAMATTHYSELKVYALTTDGVENGCCEFDVETLSPTYRLLIGIPGRSNAFAISSRLGLPDRIIESAHLHMSEEQESFEELMADLDRRRVTMERQEQKLREDEEQMKADREKLDVSQEKLESAKEKILREAREEAKQILQDAKDEADETIRIFRNAGPGASMKELEKARTSIREKINDNDSKLSRKPSKQEQNHKILKPNQLKLGDSVKVVSMGLKGTVSALPDKSGKLWVQCGIIKSQVKIEDIILIDEVDITGPGFSAKSRASNSSGKIRMSKSQSVSTEINLIGMTVDEALSELDKYLDDAYIAHLPSVRIVHGKGTGALRNAVQAHLRKTKYVANYRLGEYGEGDAGVTIAEFK